MNEQQPVSGVPAQQGSVPQQPEVPPQLVSHAPVPQGHITTPGQTAAPEYAAAPEQVMPQSPAWAIPAAQVQQLHTPELAYHQLYRGAPRYRWWKPILALLLGTLYYFAFATVIGIVVLVPYLFTIAGDLDTFEFDDAILELTQLDTQNPVSIVLGLLSVAVMLPAAQLALLSVGLTPSKRLWSVALRIRWRWIFRTIVPAVVALLVINLISFVLELALSGSIENTSFTETVSNLDMRAALISLVLVLLLVPVQATAEEVVFRGVFMQSLGAWLGGVRGVNAVAAFLRGPWLPIMIPAILFGFAHIYDIWGWLVVVMLAVLAGWLTWRTGGLEAASTLHIVNNWMAFSLMCFGVGGSTAQESETGGPLGIVGVLCGFALYAWWVDRDFRRLDGRRTRIDVVEARA